MIQARETARLEARFAGARGQTEMSHYLASAPLKIAKTFVGESGISVCVMDCSPGMLAGDCYDFRWHLEKNARVSLTTQGFTRVHPSRENSCALKQNLVLESGAIGEWFPEPLMLYQDAHLRSETAIEIAPDATLLWSEITCAGRVARGEAFGFHALQNRMRVRRDRKLIFVNQTGLRPATDNFNHVGAWNGFTHAGNFHVFSPHANQELCELLRAVLASSTNVWGGASSLDEGGVVVSLLAHRAWDLQETSAQLRAATREFLPEFEQKTMAPAA